MLSKGTLKKTLKHLIQKANKTEASLDTRYYITELNRQPSKQLNKRLSDLDNLNFLSPKHKHAIERLGNYFSMSLITSLNLINIPRKCEIILMILEKFTFTIGLSPKYFWQYTLLQQRYLNIHFSYNKFSVPYRKRLL